MDLDFHIQEFDRARFDLAAVAGAFASDPPALKRRLLELCAAVHAADGEFDFAEDEQLRRVAAALGVAEKDYADLVVTVAYEVDDIYAECERLRAAGVTIHRPPRDGHMAFIKSPDGQSVELLQRGEALPPREPWASMPSQGEW